MAYLLVCVLLATSLVASITCNPSENLDSARLTLIYNLIWDFREAPIRKDGYGKQFAVVCILNSEDETKFMFEPFPGDNVPAKGQFHDVYPVKESDYDNFIVAKPEKKKTGKRNVIQHAEPQVLDKLDSLFENYKQKNNRNASEIILFSWYLPCTKCSQKIRDTLNNKTPYGQLKRTVVFATLLKTQSENDIRKFNDYLGDTGITLIQLTFSEKINETKDIHLERSNSFQTCARGCLRRYSIPDLVNWLLSVCRGSLVHVTNFQGCLENNAANITLGCVSPPYNTLKDDIQQCFLHNCSGKVFQSKEITVTDAGPPFIRVPEDLKVDNDDRFTLKTYCMNESGHTKRKSDNQGPRPHKSKTGSGRPHTTST